MGLFPAERKEWPPRGLLYCPHLTTGLGPPAGAWEPVCQSGMQQSFWGWSLLWLPPQSHVSNPFPGPSPPPQPLPVSFLSHLLHVELIKRPSGLVTQLWPGLGEGTPSMARVQRCSFPKLIPPHLCLALSSAKLRPQRTGHDQKSAVQLKGSIARPSWLFLFSPLKHPSFPSCWARSSDPNG